MFVFFFFQAEDGIRDVAVTGVQTCALPICAAPSRTDGGTRTRGRKKAVAAWVMRYAISSWTTRDGFSRSCPSYQHHECHERYDDDADQQLHPAPHRRGSARRGDL